MTLCKFECLKRDLKGLVYLDTDGFLSIGNTGAATREEDFDMVEH